MKLFVPLLRKKFKKIKTMKKKLLIVALIAITFIGCGGKDKSTMITLNGIRQKTQHL